MGVWNSSEVAWSAPEVSRSFSGVCRGIYGHFLIRIMFWKSGHYSPLSFLIICQKDPTVIWIFLTFYFYFPKRMCSKLLRNKFWFVKIVVDECEWVAQAFSDQHQLLWTCYWLHWRSLLIIILEGFTRHLSLTLPLYFPIFGRYFIYLI